MRKLITIVLLSVVSLSAEEIYATFNVQALKEATLAFTAGGRVTSVNVDVGSHVKNDQLLATVENSEQVATLKLAQNDAMNAQIDATRSKNSYERYKKVKDIMDEEQYEKIAFATQMADINAKKAQRNVELRQAQLDKTELRAPFDGVITARYKELGDSVSGAQPQAFFTIMDLSKVKLVIEFDEKYFETVHTGDTFLYYVDGVKEPKNGVISKIYPTANSKTRKISAEIVTENIMPGLFGHGIIKVK